MADNYLIRRTADAFVDCDGTVVLRFEANGGEDLILGFHPKEADLVRVALQSLQSTPPNPENGSLPQRTSLTATVEAHSTPQGVYMALPLSDGQILEISLSVEQALCLGQSLLDNANKGAGRLN